MALNVSHPPPLVSAAVSAAVSLLKHHRSKSRWHQIFLLLSPSGLSPTEFSLVALSIRSAPHLALRFFRLTLRQSLCSHTLSSYSAIIHTLARSRELKPQTLALIQSALIAFPNQSLGLFQTLARTYREFDSAPFVFDLLIEALLRSRRIDEAIEIARLLRIQGISPTISTCNSLIRCIFKHKGSLIGYDLYKEVFSGVRISPNLSSYNEIMLALYRDGFRGNLEGIWGDLEKRGIVPNTYSYSILLKVYCQDGRMEEAARIWEEMGVKGLEHDDVAYESMIGGYCGIGKMESAEELFREMEVDGLGGSCACFVHLIIGYCNVGDLGSALLLYKAMCRRGFRPEGSVVDVVVRGFCAENKVLEGLEFLKVAMRKYEIVPKGKSYEVLIKGLCNEGMIEEALKLQVEMVGKGLEPNLEIYKAFIHGFTKQGNDEMVRKLKKEMVNTQICKGEDEGRQV